MRAINFSRDSGIRRSIGKVGYWALWQPAKASLFAAGFLIEMIEALSSIPRRGGPAA